MCSSNGNHKKMLLIRSYIISIKTMVQSLQRKILLGMESLSKKPNKMKWLFLNYEQRNIHHYKIISSKVIVFPLLGYK